MRTVMTRLALGVGVYFGARLLGYWLYDRSPHVRRFARWTAYRYAKARRMI